MLMTYLLPYQGSYPDIGHIFRTTRDELGLGIDNVCTHLGISRFYLIGLESNRIDLLPSVTETRTLINSYAGYLATDSTPILALFDQWLAACPVDVQPVDSCLQDRTVTATGYIGLKAAAAVILLLAYPNSLSTYVNQTPLAVNIKAESVQVAATVPARKTRVTQSPQETPPTRSTQVFSPKPYVDTRSADDIERDRLFYVQEQIRHGIEPVPRPYKG